MAQHKYLFCLSSILVDFTWFLLVCLSICLPLSSLTLSLSLRLCVFTSFKRIFCVVITYYQCVYFPTVVLIVICRFCLCFIASCFINYIDICSEKSPRKRQNENGREQWSGFDTTFSIFNIYNIDLNWISWMPWNYTTVKFVALFSMLFNYIHEWISCKFICRYVVPTCKWVQGINIVSYKGNKSNKS